MYIDPVVLDLSSSIKFINKTLYNTLNGERVGGGRLTVGHGKCLDLSSLGWLDDCYVD